MDEIISGNDVTETCTENAVTGDTIMATDTVKTRSRISQFSYQWPINKETLLEEKYIEAE
jgi:hypothetical protein